MLLTSKHDRRWTHEEPQTNANNAYVRATRSPPDLGGGRRVRAGVVTGPQFPIPNPWWKAAGAMTSVNRKCGACPGFRFSRFPSGKSTCREKVPLREKVPGTCEEMSLEKRGFEMMVKEPVRLVASRFPGAR